MRMEIDEAGRDDLPGHVARLRAGQAWQRQ
jgi:hypothetical protein